ncbi:MAG TPA: hypothetical protein VE338_15835 [Ktedonobacterales bacterium]|jgi:hypothetical protein|nr:hypothetical protein [Ktedonobacterales bacterium]
MSYIDTFDHELVGFFAGLPLYHPLEAVVSSGADEFGCTPDQLVLGGGDGEHPAIVLTHPTAAVVSFLESMVSPDAPTLSAEAQRFMDEMPSLDECLRFASWYIADFTAFQERCTSSAFVTPFNAAEDGLLEAWVLRNLGEFVYFALPELASDVRTRLADLCALTRRPRYFNVQILKPGYIPPAGRRRAASGEVIWGAYAWATERRATS